MKIPRAPHRWRVSPAQAIAIQRRLAPTVCREKPRGAIRLVAGVDAAFSPDGNQCIAAAVLWDIQRQEPLEQHTASRTVTFPYIPGLLSFREAPAVIAALRKLHIQPDALMFDGHGLAHPRRFGIACHVGVICNLPSIGCAKSRLTGAYAEPLETRGSKAPLEDEGEVIGVVLRTRNRVKPVFVSIGHRIDLATAEDIVLDCTIRYRLPEPTRLADRLVANTRSGE